MHRPCLYLTAALVGSVSAAPDGAAIYQAQCASCHGPRGEGVAGKSDEPLRGKRSVESLTRYIDRNMPEDEPEKCVGEDAAAVAAWIYGAFYGPDAQAKDAPRIQLSHLTREQYRQSVADLFGSFGGRPGPFAGGGLEGKYFNAEKMEQHKEHLLDRVDPAVILDAGILAAVPKLKPDSFSVTWSGSLFAPESGDYGIRAVTQNGVRVFLNALPWREGREEVPVIDGWVSRGDEPRAEETRITLTGGRAYPLRIQFLAYGQKSASLKFEWKPPGGVWETVPAANLSKQWAPTAAVVSTVFPPDDSSHGYERGIAVNREWLDAVVASAADLAEFASQQADALAGTKPGAPDRVEKLRNFCTAFAERAYRRPADDALRATVAKEFDGQAPDVAVRKSVIRVLCSPRFLYPAPPSDPADDFTAATKLALALWDSLPDEPLRKAAAEGLLKTREQIEAQARRMVDDPRTRHKLSGFFHRWLAIGNSERIAKDAKTYPDFSERLIADLLQSLELFVSDVVWTGNSDYRNLLLADYLYANPRMASYYGLPPVEGEAFAKVTPPPGQRSGVLTHPYLLASLSYFKSSSPIHRGVFVTRSVLGRYLKPPPMAIEFMDDRFDPTLTMREKVTQLTNKPACMSCHEVINPLGFSLENFDATGRWREIDSGKPVDAKGTYTTTGGETVNLTGPRDLAAHAASSREASEGFVMQLFQHTAKQAPQAYGPGTLAKTHDAFTADSYHIRNLLARIATTAAMPTTATP